MACEYGFRLTRRAADDIDSIVGYIAGELANPTAAGSFMDRLRQSIRELQTFPTSGALVVNEFLPDVCVRKTVVGNYVMYYLPDSDSRSIVILRVIYGRRSTEEILIELNI